MRHQLGGKDANKSDFQSTPMLFKMSPGPTPSHVPKTPASTTAHATTSSFMSRLLSPSLARSNPASDVKLASALGGGSATVTSTGDRIQTVKVADVAAAQQLKSFGSLFSNINKSVGSALSSLIPFQQNTPAPGEVAPHSTRVSNTVVPPDKTQQPTSAGVRSTQPQSTFVPIDRPPVTSHAQTNSSVRPNEHHQPVPAPRPHFAGPPLTRPPVGGPMQRSAPPTHVNQHLAHPHAPPTGFQGNAPMAPQPSAGSCPMPLFASKLKNKQTILFLALFSKLVRRLKGNLCS